jgi:hypothetical protein
LCADILNYNSKTFLIAALLSLALFFCSATIAHNGLHWRSTWEFVAGLTSADDKLKRDVENTCEVQSKTVQPRTKPAILLMLKLQSPAPYFANALLAAGLFSLKQEFR